MYALVIVLMVNNAPQVGPVWLYRSERECRQNAAQAPKKDAHQVSAKCIQGVTDDPIRAHGIEVLTLPDVVEPVPGR